MTHVSDRSDQIVFSRDVFSSGQVGSKLWLIQILERLLAGYRSQRTPEVIWIYGGWEGLLSFLLLSREGSENSLLIDSIRSFDLNAEATSRADLLCENWVWRSWKFKAFTADCNHLNPQESGEMGQRPSIIINTSVEHFSQNEWFDRIPRGTLVVLQGANFDHEGAHAVISGEAELAERFPLAQVWFNGSLRFDYETWGFDRSMRIGIK